MNKTFAATALLALATASSHSVTFAAEPATSGSAGGSPASSVAKSAKVTVSLTVDKKQATLANGLVSVAFDLGKGTFTVTDCATGETVIADAGPGAVWETTDRMAVDSQTDISDAFGNGKRIVLRVDGTNYQEASHSSYCNRPPSKLFSYALYEGRGEIVMSFGMKMPGYCRYRLMEASPIARAKLFPGKTLASPLTLNSAAGSEPTIVKPGLSRLSPNGLMLTGLLDGKRRTIVCGGLGNADFGKYAAIRNGVLELKAADPVGRLAESDTTYLAPDTFYLDVTTPEPFAALEKYGRAMRLANNAKPNVYDFPVLCGWSVGAMSKLPDINTSVKLVGELDAANKCGLTKYTKVGIRLEPDFYCYKDNGNSEQGWWDDEHWAKYGHLVKPYDTMAKWCAAINERNGIPYTYFQVGMPSDDYAKAFPGHMLFNDISQLGKKHMHCQPYVSFDYTDPDFQKRTLDMWKRLRQEGIRGIKFDYPESGWRSEGGFEDRFATTTSAYRKAFELAREGLGPDALLDERNLGESARPCLEVTAGIVDTQRNWSDSNNYVPAMVTIGGLRWFKNRTVFNYFPDTKTVHNSPAGIRQSMLTMVALTSGRIDLATSFSLFTPEITHDFSRIYPTYREPFTARPLDAFTGIKDPQVYDLELTPDWHQIALYNTGKAEAVVATALSGDRTANAVGLDPKAEYYAYDFWSDAFIGKLPGTAKLERKLQPNHCAMVSLRKVQPNPQVLSTNRHILQGWVELADVKWDAAAKRLSGTAKVIGGEPFKIVVADNGLKPVKTTAQNADSKLTATPIPGLSAIILERPANGDTPWQIDFE